MGLGGGGEKVGNCEDDDLDRDEHEEPPHNRAVALTVGDSDVADDRLRQVGHVRSVGDRGAPAQAALWGLGRVLFLEHPELAGGLIDLPAATAEADVEPLLSGLVNELLGTAFEEQVALRAAGRYVQRLVRHPSAGPRAAWKTHGTALITGGLGALGLHVARFLIRSGAQSLVLTSRRGLNTPGAAEEVAALQSLGARVTVAEVDLGDAAAMRALMERIDASLPPLRVVVQAAGVVHGSPLRLLPPEELERVLAPKVRGTLVLDELTRDRELDAFICFSSIAGIWGAPEMGSYAAANAFLDAWAQQQRAHGRPALSIAWGPWEGGGMASAERIAQLRDRGLRAFQPEEALNALALALTYANDRTRVLSNSIDAAIYQLRKVLGAAGLEGLIKTRRGLGYVLQEPRDAVHP
mgnify:CR=1 FL=1